MKLNKLSFGIATILLLVGCSSSVYEPPSDKYPFENKMKELLVNQIKIINSLKKAEVQILYFELPKSSNKIESIVRLLEKDGWVLKGKGQGVDTYCLGRNNRNNRINVVIPTSGELYDFKGGKLKRKDYSVNAVLYSYNKWGEDLCE
ncbi:hypothetical protein ACT400_06325 [Acinetobacter baumannii]